MTTLLVRSPLVWTVGIVLLLAVPSDGIGVVTLEAADALAVSAAIIRDLGPLDSAELTLSDAVPATTSRAPESSLPSDHMFGVLPNYATVEKGATVAQITSKQAFQMAALGSFDPYIFPFVGIMAGLSPAPGQSYGRRYGTSLADNSLGNFLTTAVLPLAMGQDPRYFQSGRGSIAKRIAYAASRSVITRDRSGLARFNVSEIGGNAIAAGLSNSYHVPAERSITGTLTRWGAQVMWDTLSNEMKEFWPDIRRKLHRS